MTTPTHQRERRQLAEALKTLRVGAGLSGARLAETLGWQQSKVSKIETRKQLPSDDDIAAWWALQAARPKPPLTCSRCSGVPASSTQHGRQRQQVIYQRGKHVQVVMLEGALRTRAVSVSALVGQLDRLIAVTGLPSLELGIIPFDAAVPVWPFGFRLYDDLVINESIDGENQLAEPEQVARYEKYLELLREAAATGRDATTVIQRSLKELHD